MALGRNYHLFKKNPAVLDVGTGTGILAAFAAMQGATRVIAVDASGMTKWAEGLVHFNNLQDKITVIRSRIEDLADLPHDLTKVDMIVSEWMGYGLFNESVLDSVIIARKKFLKPGGIILPDTAVLKMAGSSWTREIGMRGPMGKRKLGIHTTFANSVARTEPHSLQKEVQ